MFSFVKLFLSLIAAQFDFPVFLRVFAEKCLCSAGYEILRAVLLMAAVRIWKQLRPHLPAFHRDKKGQQRLCPARPQQKPVRRLSGCILIAITSDDTAPPTVILIPYRKPGSRIDIFIL